MRLRLKPNRCAATAATLAIAGSALLAGWSSDATAASVPASRDRPVDSDALEIAVEASGDELRLAPLDDRGTLIRKHFLQLDGLGVRDLHFSGDDLYVLAGPTMVLNGEIRVFRWPAARPSLAANREPARFETALTESVSLPHGRGTNRAEAICDLPPALSGLKPSWLVLYDAPGSDRKDGEHTVFCDLLCHD